MENGESNCEYSFIFLLFNRSDSNKYSITFYKPS